MFVMPVDQSSTKNEIRDYLLYLADDAGQPLSKSKADKLADKFKRGLFDPELQRVIQYSDPTGETACRNVLAAA
ncbi:hypothetical protein ACFYE2_00680 [Kocuria sp. CPCC 205300]|uniref:hypothetical protein n=1 Tax=Kocuria sabuli TaxID=3071448 RepID=UPI0036D9F36D